ncbi:MAG: DUF5706 domain-containing protein [Chitinophagaceae bacterium]|nr:DUF5706 domain-containing protein [Chitinophagaceae bacterium]
MTNIPQRLIEKEKPAKEKIRTDALLRETSTNYIRLIGDADRKARIMLVVNSIFLTISVAALTKTINVMPNVWISAAILMLSNVLTLFFSVQSVKPEFRNHKSSESENSIIHYKKCSKLTLEQYKAELKEVMQDDILKMDAVIKDIYFYGNMLAQKYRLLKAAYHIFSWGILLAVTSYLAIILFANK